MPVAEALADAGYENDAELTVWCKEIIGKFNA
jgi:hypothetical protein